MLGFAPISGVPIAGLPFISGTDIDVYPSGVLGTGSVGSVSFPNIVVFPSGVLGTGVLGNAIIVENVIVTSTGVSGTNTLGLVEVIATSSAQVFLSGVVGYNAVGQVVVWSIISPQANTPNWLDVDTTQR